MSDPIAACLAGRLAPQVAIAQLLLNGEEPPTIVARILAARAAGKPWAALHELASDGPALARLRRMIEVAGVDHAEAATPAAIAAMFDRAVAVSPEGSVAIYSLGNPARLAVVTKEIVGWLMRYHLLDPTRDVLDLGCGIGRIAASIASNVRSVHGIDTSGGMVREAEARCSGLANVSFATTDGRDLSALQDATFDLILAVDSFPYLVQSGVAARHVEEARRVLRRGGAMVVLNLSYREDGGRTDAADWAGRFGFELETPSASPFRNWDASAFIFRPRP